MNTKATTREIYLLIGSNGDGSYTIHYITDKKLLDRLEAAEDTADFERCPGLDGDGFHYDTLIIPANWTDDMLEITPATKEDVDYWLDEEEQD